MEDIPPSTARVTQTSGMSQEYPKQIRDTAIAGMWQGKKMTYLEAGSGAIYPVNSEIIAMVKKAESSSNCWRRY